MNDAAAINAETSRQISEEMGLCGKCHGHGLISGQDDDGVFFDTCPKCDGTGLKSASPKDGAVK